MSASPNGIDQISAALADARAEGRAALIPYITAGIPTLDALPSIVAAAARAGADVVEVGVPFSDPLADGPILQAAAERALARGFRVPALWPVLADAAARAAIPLLVFTYVNPVLAVGWGRFCQQVAEAGAAGLIVPDLPWVEAGPLRRAARRRGLALIPLAAPTSTVEHLRALAHSDGFVYGVSLTGVTGVRTSLDPGVAALAERIKTESGRPVGIGFGISTPEHARAVGQVADAVIVGSALMREVLAAPEDDVVRVVGDFIARFRRALEPVTHSR